MTLELFRIVQYMLSQYPKYMSHRKLVPLIYYTQVNAVVLQGRQAYKDKIYAAEKGIHIPALERYRLHGTGILTIPRGE